MKRVNFLRVAYFPAILLAATVADAAPDSQACSPAQLRTELETRAAADQLARATVMKDQESKSANDQAVKVDLDNRTWFRSVLATTNEDPQFFSRLMKNPNLPKYLQALPGYYKN